MTIEGFTTLEERGIVWQAIGFALIGIASLTVLTVYSEADYIAVEIYRLAATQLNWPFIAIIALAIDKVRKMFETRTEIRKAAIREKAIEKSREEGERKSAERIRASLLKHGIELPPELEHELFENGRKS